MILPWIPIILGTSLQLIQRLGTARGSRPGISLSMRPANERRRYIVTTPLIGWAHIKTDSLIFRWVGVTWLEDVPKLRRDKVSLLAKSSYCLFIIGMILELTRVFYTFIIILCHVYVYMCLLIFVDMYICSKMRHIVWH